MSCDMVYGQAPPTFEEDPVSKQPCYEDICKYDSLLSNESNWSILYSNKVITFVGSMAKSSSSVCPKLQAWEGTSFQFHFSQ